MIRAAENARAARMPSIAGESVRAKVRELVEAAGRGHVIWGGSFLGGGV